MGHNTSSLIFPMGQYYEVAMSVNCHNAGARLDMTLDVNCQYCAVLPLTPNQPICQNSISYLIGDSTDLLRSDDILCLNLTDYMLNVRNYKSLLHSNMRNVSSRKSKG